ncbi:hypothetical protein A4A49_01887 [Nicotiana attenuata]|uniref:Uncharacterized protein n=1 Tax=Nicotiana attenuata TaxID=49451 RepID=A0A1J6IYU7_NICAT|nr:hypothetical protein A4A49_01887 [Nicotiana attenuata]
MGECKTNRNGYKRSRDESGLDSDSHSPESKRLHLDENAGPSWDKSNRVERELEVNPDCVNSTKSEETDADVDVDSPEAKKIRDDILDILDEPESLTDGVPESQDLDSVIKSFEEEILHPTNLPPHETFADLTSSDSGESQSDLGYLLEASDDELGLPPAVSPDNYIDAELVDTSGTTNGSGNMIRLENELPRYDSFNLGMFTGIMDGEDNDESSNGDFLTVGGLFDYPDPSNFPEFSRRPESLPAI